VLLEILENDKIIVFCISYKIGLRFVHVFNLVYVVGNIINENEIVLFDEI